MEPIAHPQQEHPTEKPHNEDAHGQTEKPEAAADLKTDDVESEPGRVLAPEPTNHTDSTDAPVINYRTLSWWSVLPIAIYGPFSDHV